LGERPFGSLQLSCSASATRDRRQDHAAVGVPLHPVRFADADAGFAGQLVDWASAILRTTLHLVRKEPGQRGSQ
jgi:hypothetical protein